MFVGANIDPADRIVPRSQDILGHVFVFGPSGSGKSFFNGKMIKDRYYAAHTMVVIDSGGT